MARWVRFFIMILIGIAAGLIYGWRISPIKYVDTTPNTLRIDYKTDYVLMVAESYHAEGDSALAMRRMALLGETPADEIARQAVLFAQRAAYTDADLALMQALVQALQLASHPDGTANP